MAPQLSSIDGVAAGRAPGLLLRITIRPGPGAHVTLQGDGGSTPLFLGFLQPGVCEVNQEISGAWRQPELLPLPGDPGGALRIELHLGEDHALMSVQGEPWAVLPLGGPAATIREAWVAGEDSGGRAQSGPVFAAPLEALRSPWPLPAPPMPGRRRALVCGPLLAPAIADALAGVEEVIALAPLPWQQARLARMFGPALEGGRLRLLAAAPAIATRTRQVPARPAYLAGGGAPSLAPGGAAMLALREAGATEISAALGPLARLYLPSGGDPDEAAVLAPLAARAEEVVRVAPLPEAGALLAGGCQRFSLLRADMAGEAPRPLPRWLTPGAVRRLLDAAPQGKFVVLGTPRVA
jgi:hypothetical protein